MALFQQLPNTSAQNRQQIQLDRAPDHGFEVALPYTVFPLCSRLSRLIDSRFGIIGGNGLSLNRVIGRGSLLELRRSQLLQGIQYGIQEAQGLGDVGLCAEPKN